ncbi:MAG: glycosyltransferase family A protein [Fuerstiella sp.]
MIIRRVSVVIPLFNAEKYIRQTIESALNQQDCETEVIVVDDGSRDTSPDIVRSFGDRVRFVVQENAGPAVARNRGVAEARYNWVAFLDSDDLWEPNKLARQFETAASSDADVIYTNATNFGDVSHVGDLRLVPENMPAGDVFEALLMDNFITMSGGMLRKSLIQAVGGFRSKFRGTEDWDLWLRIAATGATFQPVLEPLTLYRWRSDSLSKNFVRMKELRESTLEAALKSKRGQQTPQHIKANAKANVAATSAWSVEQVDQRQARIWYAQALLRAPWRLDHWKSMCKQLILPMAAVVRPSAT